MNVGSTMWIIEELTLSCSNASKILKIRWPYVISNDEIINETRSMCQCGSEDQKMEVD